MHSGITLARQPRFDGQYCELLSSDEDLISIRPKTREDRPLNMTSRRLNARLAERRRIPVSVIGFGLITGGGGASL